MKSYCVRCATTREMQNPRQTTDADGKPAMTGSCPVCGATILEITSDAADRASTAADGALLLLAAESGQIDAVASALDDGVDPDSHDHHGWTPDRLAPPGQNHQVVSLLRGGCVDWTALLLVLLAVSMCA